MINLVNPDGTHRNRDPSWRSKDDNNSSLESEVLSTKGTRVFGSRLTPLNTLRSDTLHVPNHEQLVTDSLRHDSFGPREMGIAKNPTRTWMSSPWVVSIDDINININILSVRGKHKTKTVNPIVGHRHIVDSGGNFERSNHIKLNLGMSSLVSSLASKSLQTSSHACLNLSGNYMRCQRSGQNDSSLHPLR